MTAQMRGLAKVARDLGDGEIRLTVWQNLLLSGVPTTRCGIAKAAIAAIGLATQATPIRAGLIAVYRQYRLQVRGVEHQGYRRRPSQNGANRGSTSTRRSTFISTGCHHSCAQHYIGDIGLIACRVPVSDEGDTVEGFHLLVGGGHGPDAAMAHDLYNDIRIEDAACDG